MSDLNHTVKSPARRALRRPSRRGATVIMVLTLISATLAVSYAIMRSQMTVLKVQSNFDRRALARQAAMAGMGVALQKMHSSSWGGVGVAISGSLTSTESYQVTFTTGDPQLTASSPAYAEYPYRVTILSTGTSRDPANSTLSSTYRTQVVVKLVTTKLNAVSAGWQSIQAYTVYQQDVDAFNVNVPCRIVGPVRAQGKVTVGADYAWGDSTRQRYLGDLNLMRTSGYPDYRPFNGPISLPTANTPAADLAILTTNLGLTLTNISTGRTAIYYPTSLSSYRIYTGGKSYNVPQVSSTIQNTTLAPDPIDNPFGLYFSSSSVSLKSNVTVTGTLVSGGDIKINGTNVQLRSCDLPAVEGTPGAVRLPCAMALGNFQVEATGGGTATGLIAVRQNFQIDRGPASASFQVTGRVITDGFQVYERSDCDYSSFIWSWLFSLFTNQLTDPITSRITLLPIYLNGVIDPAPLLTITPPDSTIPVNSYWQNPSQPYYVADSSHPGLRWDVLRWTDLP